METLDIIYIVVIVGAIVIYTLNSLASKSKIILPGTIEWYLNRLKHKDAKVRINAARSLVEEGDPVALDPLTEALSDENEEVRAVATEALEQLRSSIEVAREKDWEKESTIAATTHPRLKINKAAAEQEILKLIDAKSIEGYEVAFKGDDKTILIDQSKNILQYERTWSLFQGHSVREQSIKYENLKKIKVVLRPSGLSSAYNEYTLGGLAVGGFAGLIVGSVIDAMRGPKKEDVWLQFEFQEEAWGDIIFYDAYYKPKVPMTEDSLEPVVKQVVPLIDKIKELFPDKVKTIGT